MSDLPRNDRFSDADVVEGGGMDPLAAPTARQAASKIFLAVGYVLVRLVIGMIVPVLLVVFLAFIAQIMINGR
jgi:hypothetical protein